MLTNYLKIEAYARIPPEVDQAYDVLRAFLKSQNLTIRLKKRATVKDAHPQVIKIRKVLRQWVSLKHRMRREQPTHPKSPHQRYDCTTDVR